MAQRTPLGPVQQCLPEEADHLCLRTLLGMGLVHASDMMLAADQQGLGNQKTFIVPTCQASAISSAARCGCIRHRHTEATVPPASNLSSAAHRRHIAQPHLCCPCMGLQTLAISQFGRNGAQRLGACLADLDEAAALLEIVHTQG